MMGDCPACRGERAAAVDPVRLPPLPVPFGLPSFDVPPQRRHQHPRAYRACNHHVFKRFLGHSRPDPDLVWHPSERGPDRPPDRFMRGSRSGHCRLFGRHEPPTTADVNFLKNRFLGLAVLPRPAGGSHASGPGQACADGGLPGAPTGPDWTRPAHKRGCICNFHGGPRSSVL
jgi:hypothetical protein